MGNKSLSQLAKDYADGKINQRDYREMRAKLIQEIFKGNAKLEENKYSPPRASGKRSKNKRKLINLQNKRPLFIVIGILSTITIILILVVFTLR